MAVIITPPRQRVEVEFLNPLRIQMLPPPKPPHRVGVIVVARFPGGITVTTEGQHSMYNLPDDKQVEVQVTYVDEHGDPTAATGPISWSSSDESIATVKPNGDKAVILPVKTGNATIKASTDVDGTALDTTFDLVIGGGAPKTGTIAPTGDPTDAPVAGNPLPTPPNTIDNTLPTPPPTIDNSLPPVTPEPKTTI